MFEYIRTHRRLMQFALLLFIIPSFAFVGVESYSNFGDPANTVAKVGDQSITKDEWEAAQQNQVEQLRQRFGEQFDPKLFDTPEAKQRVLENLVAQRALAVEATRKNLVISDQTLQQSILAVPGLTGENGSFDVERYKGLLAVQGITPAMYETRLRKDLALQQINSAIQSTAFAPKTVASRLSDLNDQERVVQELSFKVDDFVPQVKLTDAMLKAYYDKNIRQFQTPEQVKAEYVVLSSAAIAPQIAVSDADIKAYYDQNAKRYGTEEQRRASHILIATKKDASATEVAAAKTKAENLLLQVRATPASFAKLAKENSDDPGSGERGGDLELFARGAMVKPFEDAVFQMKVGQISDLVRSDFGFHIILLTDIKPASIKPLDEVKTEITAEIRTQLANKKYAEAAEVFTNTVYEQADSLKPVAEKLKLTVETVAGLTRLPDSQQSTATPSPVNNPKFLAALFGDDALKNKRNTEAVDVAPNTLVAGRVLEYRPVGTLPFEQVQAVVREQLTRIEAMNLARQAGEAKLAELKKSADAAQFGPTKTVARSKQTDLPAPAVAAVMNADTTKLPALTSLVVPDQGYSIFKITKVTTPENVDAARRQAEQQQIAEALAQEEMLAYIDVLKQKAKVKILTPAATPAESSGRADGAPY
ncbi:MAG: SurA N-terminal domain-containing protein [Pseudomonadota bacterium]